ncbi:MAG: HD domain-containing protein [Candidatus Methanomethylicia archaeon]
MVVYSFYYPEKGVMERLRDHILTALETFNVNSKLVKFGEKLNKNFYKILRYSIIFHDFGKIPFNQYTFNPNKRLDFSGHEIISCYATDIYLTKILEKDSDFTNECKKIILLAILLHHHPMKLKERLQRLSRTNNMMINSETFKIFYQEIDGIKDMQFIPIQISKSINEMVAEVDGRWGLMRELWREIWMNSDSKVKKTFLLTMQGLISADYNSAIKLRGNGEKDFAKTIHLFLKFYS